ncbi:radical SAM protein [soil metagenome]
MIYKNGLGAVLGYKLRSVGLREMFRIVGLNIEEAVLLRVARKFPSVYVSPRSIQIETTTNCNIRCTHCELSYWTEPAADMRLPELKKVFEHLPKLRRVELTGIGEPIMNRDFYRIVEYIKSRGVRISMTDNFTMMTEKAAQRIIELGVDRIAISLDGATKETFEKVRVGADFDKVTRNARQLVDMRRKMGRLKPEVLANFVVTANSYTEAPAIVELAHSLGIGLVQFDFVKTFDKTETLGTETGMTGFDATLENALERARALGVVVKWAFYEEDVPVENCSRPWNRNFVTRDGYVHPCCLTTQTGDRQAQNRRSLGNLIDQPFEDVWKSDVFTTLRKNVEAGVLPHACHMCPSYTGRPDPEGTAQAAAWKPSGRVQPIVIQPRKRGSEEPALPSG